jgi:hypothetical protein
MQMALTVNQLTDLFWSALHGLQSSTLAEATQLLTEHSVANGIGAQVAAQGNLSASLKASNQSGWDVLARFASHARMPEKGNDHANAQHQSDRTF